MKKIIITFTVMLTLLISSSSALAAQVDMNRVSEMYNNAVVLLNSKKYTQAIAEFKKVLRALPYDENIKYALGNAYIYRAAEYNNSKDYKKALNDLKSAVFYFENWGDKITDPQKTAKVESAKRNITELSSELKEGVSPAQILENARTLRTQGELAASGYDYTRLISNTNYSKVALEQLGDIYTSLNNPMGAMDCYRKILSKDDKNALIHFKYATILDGAGNEDAALDEYNAALKYSEGNPEVVSLLENLWKSRISENPNDAQSHMNLGAIYQKNGNYTAAQEQYTIARQLDPKDSTIALNLASLYTSQGNYQGAIGAYNALLDKNPNDVEVLTYRAAAYMAMKDYKGAMAQYNMVLAVDPKNAIAKSKINEIITTKLSGPEFMNYLEVEANSRPTDFDAQYSYAYQLHKNKEYQKAIPYYTQALNINPKKVEGYLNLSQLYSAQSDYKNAKAVLEQGLLHLPANPQLAQEKENIDKAQAGGIYKVASELFEKGNYKGALENYLKIPYQTPEVLLAIASCYYELGDEAKSTDYLKKTLAADPNNKDAKNALNEITQSQVKKAQAKALDDAISLYEGKKFPEALLAFKKIVGGDPKNSFAYYYLGAITDEEGKYSEAVGYYDKYLSIRGTESDEYVKYVKSRAAELKAYLLKK